MSGRKWITMTAGFVLAAGLISASLSAVLLTNYHNRMYFQVSGDICRKVMESSPESRQAILSALKEYRDDPVSLSDENILLTYGYRQKDILHSVEKNTIVFIVIGFAAGGALFIGTLFFRQKTERVRIAALTDYLERINTGESGIFLPDAEDDFSGLQDEICKTVTELYETREAALRTKNRYAENLYNIAHQIKTPITSIALSLRLMQEDTSSGYSEQIRRQLSRLTHLEEALLLLSRIDAGTLVMEQKEVDVFTLLELAADHLRELFREAEVSVEIPESGEMLIRVDPEWTMEAVINLLKNCMEHTPPGGRVRCFYEQNPLYTQIRITDSGAGFAKEDIPHLFERFYRGKNAGKDGIGIGLALSREIIERQNGVISAQNSADGGACFEIRFYRH